MEDSVEYPDPICQDCGKECEISEEVHTGEAWELWNYCKSCDRETNHQIPEQFTKDNFLT